MQWHDPFLARTHREALSLLEETRNLYLRECAVGSGKKASLDDLCVTTEWLVVTSRLGAVIGWILERKDHQGASDAPGSAFLSSAVGPSVWREKSRYVDFDLPPALRSLLERSWSLYQRICRIDQQMQSSSLPVTPPGDDPNLGIH